MPKFLMLSSLIAFSGLAACQTTLTPKDPVSVTQQIAPTALVATPIATSNADFATTSARLKTAIESRGLTLFNTIDHAAGAAKVDQQLAPNTLYIFGNPKAGTPLMLANPAMGLHLPLKAQVYEDAGTVFIAVSDITAITAAAGVSEPALVINKIAETLSAIQSEASGS